MVTATDKATAGSWCLRWRSALAIRAAWSATPLITASVATFTAFTFAFTVALATTFTALAFTLTCSFSTAFAAFSVLQIVLNWVQFLRHRSVVGISKRNFPGYVHRFPSLTTSRDSR